MPARPPTGVPGLTVGRDGTGRLFELPELLPLQGLELIPLGLFRPVDVGGGELLQLRHLGQLLPLQLLDLLALELLLALLLLQRVHLLPFELLDLGPTIPLLGLHVLLLFLLQVVQRAVVRGFGVVPLQLLQELPLQGLDLLPLQVLPLHLLVVDARVGRG